MTAAEQFADRLADLADRNRQTPCQAPGQAWRWIADEREHREAAAKACGRCPLRLPCLGAALEQDDQHTARGGHDLGTPSERRAALAELDRLTTQETA